MIDEEKYLINIYNSYNVSVSGLTVLDINQESGSPLFIDRSRIIKLEHITISNLSMTPLIIKNSEIGLMDDVSISYFENRVEISNSEILMISNSVFSNIHSTQDLFLSNSNASITNSYFFNNSAERGGAIFYSCAGEYKWTLKISESEFRNNSASICGGAIHYETYRPILSNNTFEGNTANYGPDIASYPIKIKVKGSDVKQIVLDNIGSGVEEELRTSFIWLWWSNLHTWWYISDRIQIYSDKHFNLGRLNF